MCLFDYVSGFWRCVCWILIAALVGVFVTVSLGGSGAPGRPKQAMADLAARRHQDALLNADWPCTGAADAVNPT